jgi:hypothetical protein
VNLSDIQAQYVLWGLAVSDVIGTDGRKISSEMMLFNLAPMKKCDDTVKKPGGIELK